MKNKKLTLIMSAILALILLATPFLTSCGSSTSTTTTTTTATVTSTTQVASLAPLKIGMMTPSTGPVPEKGIPGQHGIQDAMEYINKELNGAEGHPIVVDWRDSAYNASQEVNIVNDFMSEGDIMFTTHSSSEMNNVQAIANEAGFPGLATFISTMNLHPALHIYGPTPDYGDDFVALIKYYKNNVWKGTGTPKVALHLLQGSVGKGTLDGANAMAAELGVEIVDTEYHLINTTSEIDSLTKIKAANPDVLIISGVPASTAIIIENAKTLGMYPGITIMCASASYTKSLVDTVTSQSGADAIEGVYGVFHTVSWEDDVPGIAKAKEYCLKNHASDYGNMDYLSTWSTCMIIRQILITAVQNAGYDVLAKGDAASWKAVEEQGIQKLSGYTVGGLQGGTVTYTPGDNRLDKYLRMYQVKNGIITALGNWEEAPLIKYTQYGDK